MRAWCAPTWRPEAGGAPREGRAAASGLDYLADPTCVEVCVFQNQPCGEAMKPVQPGR